MRHLALALALISTAAYAQPDLIVQDLYTDSLCLGPNPYFSIHFTITNIGDETCEYFCYEKNGIEVCPDTTLFDMSLDPNESRYYYLGWLNYDGFGEPYTIEVVNAVDEVNTLNNELTMIVPDAHICEEMLSVDLAIDTVLYNTGCDEYGPYLDPSIYMTNLGTDDITELCIKFQVLGQTNDTVCFTGQSYLPLESGESAVQYWPRIYADGVLSLHLLDVNGPSPFSWLDFGIDEWTYNNTYVEVLPVISSGWCISGCTDETACNYMIEAFLDDGGCEYPELYYDCDGECEYEDEEARTRALAVTSPFPMFWAVRRDHVQRSDSPLAGAPFPDLAAANATPGNHSWHCATRSDCNTPSTRRYRAPKPFTQAKYFCISRYGRVTAPMQKHGWLQKWQLTAD